MIRQIVREILAEQDDESKDDFGSTPGLYRSPTGEKEFVFQMSDFSKIKFPTPSFEQEKEEVSGEERIGISAAVPAADVAKDPSKYGIRSEIFTPNGGRPGKCASCLHPVYKDMRSHEGIDIAPAGLTSGAEVLAVADGQITKIDTSSTADPDGVIQFGSGGKSSAGNTVTLFVTAQSVSVRYLHLETVTVSLGSIKKGQTIGRVGATGIGTGPHLHFEVRKGTNLEEPATYLSDPSIGWVFPVALLA